VNSQIVTGILKEFGYWFLFTVVIALAQLWLIPCAYYLTQKQFTWVELIGNGSLLFFATTITSKTAGEYFKKVKTRNEGTTLLCLTVMFIIIIPAVFTYALVTASRVGIMAANSLSPERVAMVSDVLAASGLLFSLAYTFIIRAYEN
jgi:hypothetical protein